MKIYFFHQAPMVLQEMSPYGGDEDFVILIPDVGNVFQVWDNYAKKMNAHVVDANDCWNAQYNVVERIAGSGDSQHVGFWKDTETGVNYQVWITAHA